MGEGDDWLMRPVLAGMCHYESLINGAIDLLDIARMNDALDVQSENERRIHEALNPKRQS
jgi:hypothetical protein